jgi:hypothetical protein
VGSVATCTVELDSAPDDSTWSTGGAIGAQTCTTGGTSGLINANVAWVRINLATFTCTAGSTCSIYISYAGYSTTGTSQYTTLIPLENCVPDSTGNIFWTTAALTAYNLGHWELVKNTAVDLNCTIRIPHNVATVPSANIVLDMAANDGTASHTDAINTADAVVTATASINPASLSSASAQNYTTTSTAYSRVTLTFAVQSTVIADNILIVDIHQAASNSVTNNLLIFGAYLQINQVL